MVQKRFEKLKAKAKRAVPKPKVVPRKTNSAKNKKKKVSKFATKKRRADADAYWKQKNSDTYVASTGKAATA